MCRSTYGEARLGVCFYSIYYSIVRGTLTSVIRANCSQLIPCYSISRIRISIQNQCCQISVWLVAGRIVVMACTLLLQDSGRISGRNPIVNLISNLYDDTQYIKLVWIQRFNSVICSIG